MKVLLLADAVFVDKPGGSRVVARELSRGLIARGHEVTFLVSRQAPDTPDEEIREGARVIRYASEGGPKAFIASGKARAEQLWAETKFDVVHSHFAYAAEGPSQVTPASVPHIRTFHGPWDAEGYVEDTSAILAAKSPVSKAKKTLQRTVKYKMRHSIEKHDLERSGAVTVLSNYFGNEVLRFGIPKDKIHLIPGGANIERFFPTDDGRAGARQRLDLPQDREILFTVRRLAPRMGLDNLIRAMKKVVAQYPKALLLLGGKGPEQAKLEGIIAELGLSDNVRLVGFIPDDHLADYFRAANLFVLPTMALEGFGLVTVEALASGTPVIGTPVGGTVEILSGLDRRLLAGSVESDALAEAILGFLGSPLRQELTPERLHQFILDKYTWDRHVTEIEALYNQLRESKKA